MLALTTPIAVPNIQKIRVASVQVDDAAGVALVTLIVQGGAGVVYRTLQVGVRDGSSEGVRAKASPVGYQDIVEVFAVATPTGLTDLMTAYTGGLNARNKSAETAMIAAGLLPAGVVS